MGLFLRGSLVSFSSWMRLFWVASFTVCYNMERSAGYVTTASVSINTVQPLHTVEEKFVSVCLSPRAVTRFDYDFNPRDPRLVTLVSGLSPGYLRLGGTSADFLIFNNTKLTNNAKMMTRTVGIKKTNFTMTVAKFDMLNTLVKQAGMDLLFNLNLLLRRGNDWDSENARQLLTYSIRSNYTHYMHLELGNEPDAFPNNFGITISGSQVGRDLQSLHALIRDDPTFQPYFSKALLVGPDITHPEPSSLEFLKEYIKVAGPALDRVTFHQYYMNCKEADIKDFLSPSTMNVLEQEISDVRQALQDVGRGDMTVWFGETGTCLKSRPGLPVLSECYVAGFLWLDKLGVAARSNIPVVMRQVLFDGVDGLLDEELNVRPDYWLTVLFKRLVGTRVLDVKLNTSLPTLRIYAHCTNVQQYENGAVTYYAMNMGSLAVQLSLVPDHMTLSKHIYWLTPGDQDGLESKFVALNGKKVEMVNNTTLPELVPVKIPAKEPITLPAHTFGFIVIPDARAHACL